MSLLEADVDFQVAKEFLAGVKASERLATRSPPGCKRPPRVKMHRITPGQQFVKACQEELDRPDGARSSPASLSSAARAASCR